MSEPNAYMQAARLEKSLALTAALRLGKITADEAALMNRHEWETVAKAIRLSNPPSITCRQMVIDALRVSA